MRRFTDANRLAWAASKSLIAAYQTPQIREEGDPQTCARRLRALPEIQAIISAPDETLGQCMVAAASDLPCGDNVLELIAAKRATLPEEDLEAVLASGQLVSGGDRYGLTSKWGHPRVLVRLIERAWAGCDDEGRDRLAPLLARTAAACPDPAIFEPLRGLVTSLDRVTYELIDDSDNVGRALRAILEAARQPDAAIGALLTLLAGFPAEGKPDGARVANAAPGLAGIPDLASLTGALLDVVIEAADPGHGEYTSKSNEAILCGLAALAGHLAAGGEAELLPRLRELALKAAALASGWPVRSLSIRLATHCVAAIGDAALPASVTELLRVERGTRHGPLLRAVREAIDALAAVRGMRRDELMERAVQDHGLAPDGTRQVVLADGWTAVLAAGVRSAAVEYLGADGKVRKSLPTAVKNASAQTLAELQQSLKAVRATIRNERARLDGLLSVGQRWDAATWRELYLDHPVTGRLTQALIWTFESEGGRPSLASQSATRP